MNEPFETYIIDPEKAKMVAYASRDERYAAVGSRLIDAAIAEIFTDESLVAFRRAYRPMSLDETFGGTIDIVQTAKLAKRIKEVSEAYPQAVKGISLDKNLSGKSIIEQVPDVLSKGGLPIETTHISSYKVTAEKLDQLAEEKEAIAEALYDSPPSADFIREYSDELGHRNIVVEVVVSLRDSAEYLAERAREFRRQADNDLEVLGRNDPEIPRILRAVPTLRHRIGSELRHHFNDEEFEKRAMQKLDDEQTRLGDVIALVAEGYDLIVNGYTKESQHYYGLYNQIVSGNAHNFAQT